jgi:transposase
MKGGLLGGTLGHVIEERARAGALSAAPRPPPHRPEEPHSRHADRLRQAVPVSDLLGHAGREILDRLQIPDAWRANVDASLRLIDDLELQIAALTGQLKRMGADHRYIALLVTAPGFGWINAFTVASDIGDITRFASPAKLSRPRAAADAGAERAATPRAARRVDRAAGSRCTRSASAATNTKR